MSHNLAPGMAGFRLAWTTNAGHNTAQRAGTRTVAQHRTQTTKQNINQLTCLPMSLFSSVGRGDDRSRKNILNF